MSIRVSRRNFLKSGALIGAGAVAAASTLAFADDTGKLGLTQLDIPVQRLPRSFYNYKIFFMSDLHLANCVPQEWVTAAIAQALECKPDLVLLGGDFIWIPDRPISAATLTLKSGRLCGVEGSAQAYQLYKQMGELLRRLTPPDGTYSILGNHDNWVARNACLEQLTRARVRFLINHHTYITRGADRLVIYGSDDYLTGIPRDPRFPLREQGNEVRVVLSHNPDFFSHFVDDPRYDSRFDFDLALAGHTHGGQIKLPGVGALQTGIEDSRFLEGLKVFGKCSFYTTRGVGVVGIPIRINCPPEVVLFNLVQA